jgi:hypothetical protein
MTEDTAAADTREIIDVCTRMHWCLDHKDWDGLDTVLSEWVSSPTIAEQSREGFDPADFIRSRTDIKVAYPALLDGLTTQHLITGHQVELNGDRAVCRAHSINVHIAKEPAGNSRVVHGNEYQFDLERTKAGWRICGRQSWIIWTVGNEAIHNVTERQERWAQTFRHNPGE